MLSTIIISAVFVVLLVFAGRYVFRNVKAGKCSGCSGCDDTSHESGCSCCGSETVKK
ncbi:FeoB-associated Cys-rich membrane protein [Aminipila butyrica]|uniref:FeoB-associated Cys-rich membrane protein n=1 Tax=Aminipila butyrica TaxID=433296 RepID=A0A858BRJ6_9FIRM|nr:FeoB-associated Cys-rich membrane protein [Aminipila butyrica]QIB68513.1 FeoB-associated Cys-rich membrane protein [Aminipila butyrica]